MTSLISKTLIAVAAAALLAAFAGAPLAGAGEERRQASTAAKTKKQKRIARAERRMRVCANYRRSRNGLPPVRAARKLNRAARMHARNMAKHRFFSHTDHRGRSPFDRVRIFDRNGTFVAVGENIAAGFRSVRGACRGWMRSKGHRENMLRRGWTHIGTGFALGGPYGRYYVQVFGTKG